MFIICLWIVDPSPQKVIKKGTNKSNNKGYHFGVSKWSGMEIAGRVGGMGLGPALLSKGESLKSWEQTRAGRGNLNTAPTPLRRG